MKYTSTGNAGAIPPDGVTVKMNVAGQPISNIVVPAVGSESGCPSGLGACDSDPNNGCETNTNTSNEFCGSCFTPCDPQGGTGQCNNGTCELTGCDPTMSNCNMMADDGCEVNLLNDATHCGSCTNSCVKTNTTSFCNGGNCNIIGCQNNYADCNVNANDGCETNLAVDMSHCGGCNQLCQLAHAAETCVPSLATGLGVCTLGACDAGYKNCDLMVPNGCEVDLMDDVNNCGNCFQVCAFDHAADDCQLGMCQMGMCDMGYDNCNVFTADGCEAHLTDDEAHCGTCATNCDNVYINASTTCTNSACVFNGCDAGFYNLDAAPGCEYACTFTTAADVPDDGFVDANCDGIDGTIATSIFVSPSGNDGNPGTKAAPVQTIPNAITKAIAQGKTTILASSGTYTGRVTLSNGISLYGGYALPSWSRSNTNVSTIQATTVLNGRVSAVEGTSITSPTTVDRFTITAAGTSSASTSVYGVWCSSCTGLTLSNNVISAGNGGSGTSGTPGTSGGNGTVGTPGFGVDCDTNGSGGVAGSGGTNASCGRNGGAGGHGGSSSPGSGGDGGTGVSGVGGGGGGAGDDPGGDGGNGTNGPAGTPGTNGGGGSSGVVNGSGFWATNGGVSGTNGTHGNGGGGGGGGGGQGCFTCNNGQGNGGGGGGAGGCLGTLGSAGTGGGGSFGVFLVSSTGVVLTNNTISSGNGGNGGSGAAGGAGGSGAAGGAGGMVCTSEVGAGGKGGNGGAGGAGGAGGGGAGGPSYGVYRSGTTVSTSTNTISHGNGGSGGTAPISSGANGASNNLF